ncbi:NAD(P)/FAD-dependent oxidoreductase [Celeribacter sp.]|uniref:NAD(P)/FAD-dependent oxidoreductase n=1 Tax=Celeribacter sp. TaxID=1890673 RepID=UPI003A944A57
MPSETVTCDVLIVGGGPAGLATAQTLAPHARVLVVHQDREIGRPVRTSGGTFVDDMEALGVPPHLYNTINTLDIRSDNARSLHHLTRRKLAVLDITATYQWLADDARAAGATILTGTKFITTHETAEGYESEIRALGAKDTQTVRSRYIVDASGTPHAVLTALGIDTRPERTGVGIEREFEIISAPKDRAVLFVGGDVRAGYGWIFPAPNNHIRIGVGIIQPDHDISPREVYDTVVTPEFLRAHDLELGPLVQTNAGVIPSVPYAPTLLHGNVIRVGDTANFATPTVGEGIRFAIKYGRVLGAALADTLATGRRTPLERYERECRKAFGKNYRIGFAANRRIATYDAAQWDKSVARIARLNEDEVLDLIRSEFPLRSLARTIVRQGMWKASRVIRTRLAKPQL